MQRPMWTAQSCTELWNTPQLHKRTIVCDCGGDTRVQVLVVPIPMTVSQCPLHSTAGHVKATKKIKCIQPFISIASNFKSIPKLKKALTECTRKNICLLTQALKRFHYLDLESISKNCFHTTFSQDSHIFQLNSHRKVQKSFWNSYCIFMNIIHNVMAVSKDRHIQWSNIGHKQVTWSRLFPHHSAFFVAFFGEHCCSLHSASAFYEWNLKG